MDKDSIFIIKVFKIFKLLAALILFANCVLVVANIITRSALFKSPIFGVYEMVCYLSLISISFALAGCAIEGGHTRLTFLVEKLSEQKHRVIEIIINIVILINFILITWNLIRYMISRYFVGDVSPVMRIPIQYIVAFIVVGFILLTLTPLVKIIEDIRRIKKPS